MSSAIQALLSILDLEQLEDNLFRGRSPHSGWQRVYGGQVIGQALVAAARTVDGRGPHSLHGYFLLAGDPSVPIIYNVERIRDGRSFTTRRVVAVQHGRAIFFMSVSFQIEETGYEHQIAMPDVPAPDDLPSEAEMKERFIDVVPDNVRRYWERERPIELRPISYDRYFSRTPPAEAVQHIWVRANGSLPDDPAIHRCVMAYASDMTLLDTSLLAHGRSVFDTDMIIASLDHALWFHRPFRADEWMLYSQESPNTGGARGFNRGSLFTRGGTLIASVAQEGLIRPKTR
jgi:acyl-CoA thioesterase II